MLEGSGKIIVRLVPATGAKVVLGELRWLTKALMQQLSKEVMVSIPVALVVEWNKEQVGVFEPFQSGLARAWRGFQHRLA